MSPIPARPAWTNRHKDNWDDAYTRIMAWWEGASVDRPALTWRVPRPGAAPFPASLDPGTAAARDLDEGYQMARHEHEFQAYCYLAEAAPAAKSEFGSLLWLLADMAGAQVQYTPQEGTAWIDPIPDLYDRPLPQFDPQACAYAFALRMIDRHAETFGYDCVLGANALLDPLTTLAMMRGPQQLCLDVLERPADIKRWTRALGDMFLAIAAGFRAARARHNRREDASWCTIWAPGDMEALQCDFSTMLSPAQFADLAMPELEREVEFYDYALWHLDGPAEIRHLDMILAVPQIRAFEWPPHNLMPAIESIELFQRIRRAGRSIVCTPRNEQEAIAITRQVGKDGLALRLMDLPGPREVEELERKLRRL